MMTKSMWVFATAVLASAACSGDNGTSGVETTTPPQGQSTSTAGTTAPSTTTGSSTSTGAAAGRTAPPTASTSDAGAAVTTGNSAAAGTSAGRAGAGASGGAGARSAAGTGGSGGAQADDDAGVIDVGDVTPEAGSGGTGGATGGRSAAGAGGVGAGGTAAAGSGGAGAAGARSEGPGTVQVPSDPGKTGPWPVGVRTVNLNLGIGNTPVEVWYPAKPGSDSERAKVSYDLTAWLPPEHGIPASAPKVLIQSDAYRDLPPDSDHGPFPAVVLVHGQASFRAASVSQLTHWASRGFIAIAADHPGLVLRDTLSVNPGCSGTGIPQDLAHTRDVPALFAALAQPDGVFSFLTGVIDAERIALAGHGDGAGYAADNGEQAGVRAVLSFSDASVIPREGAVAGAFFLSGTLDKIVPYGNVVRAFDNTARGLRPALLAGVNNVGHLAFTDLCSARNSDGQDAIAMARRYDICGGAAINLADQYLWDCPLSPLAGSDNYLDQAATTALVRKLSTLALEELLLGENRTQAWNDLAADTSWGELRQTR